MGSTSCYTHGCQALACREFNEVICDPVHHCSALDLTEGLPYKSLAALDDTAGSAVVIAAKLGGMPLYRLQFSNTGFYNMIKEYSSCGQTMDLQHFAFTSFVQLERFPRRKVVVWLAFYVPGKITDYGDPKELGF